MDTLQLEYFLTVAHMGNMTTAASALHVAQSSVSRSIARLEEELGVELFDRSGRGIVLNNYGKMFSLRAETILRERDASERELKEVQNSHFGRIAISTCSPRAVHPLAFRFMTKHPDILYRQKRLSDLSEIQTLIDTSALDFALTYTPLSDMEHEWTPLITERFYMMLPANHPLADREYLKLEDLAGQSLLLSAYDNPDTLENYFRQTGISPLFTFISEEYDQLGPLVEQGVGCAFITSLALYDLKVSLPIQHFPRLRILPLREERMQRTLGILWRKNHHLSAAATDFYQALLEHFHDVDQQMNDLETL